MPTSLKYSFSDNFKKILVDEHGNLTKTKVIKINISLVLYRQLHYMNISPQTLFEDNLNTLGETIKMKMFTARHTDILADNTQNWCCSKLYDI
jgi:hypothetical protein